MLYRRIASEIERYLASHSNKMLLVDGARQVGKSYIIRYIGQKMFANYIEINMEKDKQKDRLFEKVRSVEDFYIALSTVAGHKMKQKENTLVFIDEIQAYDQLLTLVKFLMEDGRFTYIASGSQLGIALKSTQSIPIGSIQIEKMYPLDFEEFIMANGVGQLAIDYMKDCFEKELPLSENMHEKIMDLFRKYLLVGGLPDAVNVFLAEHNLVSVRKIHKDIILLYRQDAAKYEMEVLKKLKIQRIYDMIPSTLENRKKRIVAKDIENKVGKRMANYQDEFDYLISAGISLSVQAVSQPVYPLLESCGKNLVKLYLNDVGLLTSLLYHQDINPIFNEECSVNLGSVYENVVAQQLKTNGFPLFYYDNKKNGEVDFLLDDADNSSVLPIEVKSGKDYSIHSALNKFVRTEEFRIKKGIVLSNERNVVNNNGILYMPIYFTLFLRRNTYSGSGIITI